VTSRTGRGQSVLTIQGLLPCKHAPWRNVLKAKAVNVHSLNSTAACCLCYSAVCAASPSSCDTWAVLPSCFFLVPANLASLAT